MVLAAGSLKPQLNDAGVSGLRACPDPRQAMQQRAPAPWQVRKMLRVQDP
tara:strand:- start:83 stop:232 length:150 start_codon:yes stop_codon:yes gene_type:complete